MNSDIELIGGPEHRKIILVPYNLKWPEKFITHKNKIKEALGPLAERVEHIGSTSLPGMTAKPIIDIQLSIADVDDEMAYLPQLEKFGYVLRVRERGHRMVRTPELDVHLHICSVGSEWERRHLLFRDWLRTNQQDFDAYAKLKNELAEKDWETMNHYADAKSTLIKEITQRAEHWAERTNWQPTG